MTVEFDKSFLKSLDQIKDKSILKRIENVIEKFETAKTLSEVANIKKLSGHAAYYRIKLGDYRLGFELINPQTVRMILVAHRKTIYRKFP